MHGRRCICVAIPIRKIVAAHCLSLQPLRCRKQHKVRSGVQEESNLRTGCPKARNLRACSSANAACVEAHAYSDGCSREMLLHRRLSLEMLFCCWHSGALD